MKRRNLLIALLGILALIYSCRQDDFTITSEGEEHGPLVPSPKSNITFQEFLTKFPDKGAAHAKGSSMVDLSKYRFGGTPTHAAARTESTSVIQFIDTTKVLAFDFSYIQTYTFEVIPTEMEANAYYNMVFSVDSLGTHSRLFKYVANAAYIPGSDEAFTGIIYEIAEDGTVITTYTQQDEGTTNVAARVVSCSFSVITINIPCTGVGHEPGETGCLCGTSDEHSCTPAETIKLTDITCQDYGVGGGGGIDDGNSDGGSSGSGSSGGSSGGEEGPVLPEGDVVYQFPTELLVDIPAKWAAFQNTLTANQLNYLNGRPVPNINLRNKLPYFIMHDEEGSDRWNAASDLIQFLVDNPDEYDFGMEALDALREDGEVDLEYRVIYFMDDKECQEQIIKDLMSVSSSLTDLINNTFNVSENAHLKITYANLTSNASTDPFYIGDSNEYLIKIIFDEDFLNNATDLGIAVVFLHELTHAYFTSLYISGLLYIMGMEGSSYSDLLSAFIAFYADPNLTTFDPYDAEIHSSMDIFIDAMAESLYTYTQSKGMTNISLDYCKKLSWGSMIGYDLFSISLTLNEQNEYNDIFKTEQDNIQYVPTIPIRGNDCN